MIEIYEGEKNTQEGGVELCMTENSLFTSDYEISYFEPRSESDTRVNIRSEKFTSFFFNYVLEPKVSRSDSDLSKRLNLN